MADLTDAQLEELYRWVDSVPLCRQKKNLHRDFSDGVLLAELIHHFLPREVILHNYDESLRIEGKIFSWKTLNRKVLLNLGLNLDSETITSLAQAKPGFIERILWDLKQIITERLKQKKKSSFEVLDALPNFGELDADQQKSDERFLEQKIAEVEDQAEYIAALEAKIAKLEELMIQKDAKIAQLNPSPTRTKRSKLL
jgi:hypothetical protein